MSHMDNNVFFLTTLNDVWQMGRVGLNLDYVKCVFLRIHEDHKRKENHLDKIFTKLYYRNFCFVLVTA